ncbi:rolling circle replication-associated protein [Enterovibrio calviensis]|uniref:rolling circle replication-associated protein n=1 Tax=Enterovibrio calviensis TaxID=91359 RepID=UPI0012DF27D2|nr:hypothetical protein [Enterovibrio calviensis]
MTIKDIRFIAGTLVSGDVLSKRLSVPPKGETHQSWFDDENAKLRRAHSLHCDRFGLTMETTKLARAAAEQSDGKTRLVKGCKSPTPSKEDERRTLIANQAKHLQHKANGGTIGLSFADQPPETHHDAYKHYRKHQLSERGRSFRILHQSWSGKYRAGIFVQPRPQDAPAPMSGARLTENLTQKAVRKIFESAAYVATLHGGFTTFLTLTFDSASRARLFAGDEETPETTVGREVSRFLDGAKKMYQRGSHNHYSTENDPESGRAFCPIGDQTQTIEPQTGDFHYIWVAECPVNEDGEPNPHVHVLLNWKVDKPLFRSWASRLESLWGHGFANLQRMKYSRAAGSYIIKAVGYAAKGDNGEQGLIRGNRYGIAQCSRAPAFECLASFDADCMGAIIAEYRNRLDKWRMPIMKLRSKTKKKIAGSAKALQITRKSTKLTESEIERRIGKLKSRLSACDELMKATDKKLNDCGRMVSKDHPLVHFDGDGAKEKLDRFLVWAVGHRGWVMNSHDIEECEALRQEIKAKYGDISERFTENQLIHESRIDWLNETGWTPELLELNSYGEKQTRADHE